MQPTQLVAQVEALDLKTTDLLIVRGIPVDEEDTASEALMRVVPRHVRILFAPLEFHVEQLDAETMDVLGWVRKGGA